jgi:dipeptidyl aminopeptidase/acylaminoacyl peptidase
MSDSDHDVLEELASLPTFHHPTASPDGSEAALYYDTTGRNELSILDVESGERQQISDGEVPRNARWFVKWDADGERVFFHLDDDGNEQNDIYAIDREGRVESVVELDGQTVLADIADDGESLLIQSTANGQLNLYRHDVTTGDTTQLTDYDRAVMGAVLSPDGERMAYATNESDDIDNRDVYVAGVDGSDARNLHIGETGAEATIDDWDSDGKRLLVSDNTEDLSRCGVYDLQTDEIEWYGDLAYEEVAISFLPDGERFLALRTHRASKKALVYDTTSGEARELDLPEGVVSFAGSGEPVLDNNHVLLTHTTPDSRPELLAYDLTTDETRVLIEAEYGSFDPDEFTDAEYFRFESHDGMDIGALLYDSGERPSPLIMNPHGGPRWADYRSFSSFTQFLVSRGYSVLQVNYRGSTGRGREFVELLKQDWGGDEQADIAAAVNLVSEYDWIDEDRVGVFGASYGGYSAYWQMVQYPELYDAGIARIGVTDLKDMYDNTMPHFKTGLMEKYLGLPEDNPDLYRERSPVTHVENLSAPLLMVHGVNDRRVPVSQARIFRAALEDAGYEERDDIAGDGKGDFEYVELGEEGHASSDIDQKIRTFRILDDFLDRRLATAPTATSD